jgi:hypothetical protein
MAAAPLDSVSQIGCVTCSKLVLLLGFVYLQISTVLFLKKIDCSESRRALLPPVPY